MVLFIADNLGLHTIFGYNECFRANYPCHICRIRKEDINTTFDDNHCELRNRNNYADDLGKRNPKLTGIKEECAFHEIDFHCTENVAVDIQHDYLEGVCPRDVAKILRYFVTHNFCSLDNLNQRIIGFYYSRHDKRNKSPQISELHLKNSRLKMSSAEMLCLIRNLPMILGDLIPETHLHWKLLILLFKMVQIVTAKAHQPEVCNLLETLTSEY